MSKSTLNLAARPQRRRRRPLLALLAAASLALPAILVPGPAPAAAAPALDPAAIEADTTAQDQMVLRYSTPANDWQSRSLPIGNGAMGASIFGGVGQDSIQMNEK
ncbi:Uncharacterised protein [Actinomyces bovis]|uniref:Glycosyl hydrolase family 95 N-terminal domain-containing protein n=1 Tax=Actinomyces bovis TaxID=1658 RepID=A0ABY1VL78_9ACTO|nr:Uncharacterised protein [Actinomyces bovis]VEG54228.1 Uncharacterised protein [Actinomyces israelii]